jgi:hypothetical protein
MIYLPYLPLNSDAATKFMGYNIDKQQLDCIYCFSINVNSNTDKPISYYDEFGITTNEKMKITHADPAIEYIPTIQPYTADPNNIKTIVCPEKTCIFVPQKSYRERYKKIAKSEWFNRAYENMTVGDIVLID